MRAAPDSPRAVVHVLHDLAEHSGRYEPFARYLAGQELAVMVHDHRGHGKTEAPDAPRGQFATGGGSAKLLADIHAIQERIVADHGSLPALMLGQGFGAAAALGFVFGHHPRIAGAAIWGMPVLENYPGRFLSAMLRWERFRLGSDVPSPTMRRLTLQAWSRHIHGARTQFNWISDDPAVVDAYVDDPDCGFEPSIGMWLDALRMLARSASPRLIGTLPRDFPLLIAAGEADPVTGGTRDHERLLRILEEKAFSNLESKGYADMRHDLVNPLNRNLTWQAFAQWVDHVIGSTPCR